MNPKSHARRSSSSSNRLRPTRRYTEKAMMTAARAALTTGSGTLVNISRPNGMPNMVERTQPPGAARMDLPPVLQEDEPGDRDRDEDGHRGGDLDRDD